MVKKTHINNPILEGDILKTTIKLSIPIAISYSIYLIYSLVDTFFISLIDKSNTSIVSGAGLIFPIFFLFSAIYIGLTTGIAILVARGIGQKNREVVNLSADSGFFLSSLLFILVILFGYVYSESIIKILAGKELSNDAILYGLQYFRYCLPGFGIQMLISNLTGVLQGEGLMKQVARYSIVGILINAILDPILIFGFNMGIAGAGLSTSISNAISLICFIIIFATGRSTIKIQWNPFKFRKNLIKEIVKFGFPQSMTFLFFSIQTVVLNWIVSSIGETHMNYWTICIRSDLLMSIPVTAISTAALTMLGQNLGACAIERVKLIYKKYLQYIFVSVAVFASIYILLAPLFFPIMSNVTEVVNGGIFQIRILSFSFIGYAINQLVGSAMQVIGKPLIVFYIQFLRVFIFTLPPVYIMVYTFNMGMMGVFAGIIAGRILSLGMSLIIGNRYFGKAGFKKIAY